MGAFANNPPAYRCYESAGFKRTGTDIWKMEFGDWECIELEYDMTDIEKLKPVLETERLILRMIQPDDYLDAFEWCGDPVVNKFMLYPLYTKAEDVRTWIESIDHTNPDSYEYCFVEKETGKVIGSGGLYYHPDIDVWAVGYNLRHDRWNKGYVTEAEKAIIAHVNSVRPIRELQGEFACDNGGSGRVMEKLGMSYLMDAEYTRWDGSATFKAKVYSSLGAAGTRY